VHASLHHRPRQRGFRTLPSTTIPHTGRDKLERSSVKSQMAHDRSMSMSLRRQVLGPAGAPALGPVAGPENGSDPPRAEDHLPYMHPGKSENDIQPSGSSRKMDHDRAGGVAASGSSTQLVHRHKADRSSRAPQRSHVARAYTGARSSHKPLTDRVPVFGGRRWTQRATSGTI
jgi:hypothetical protein